jgi:ABC-type phosphate transport system permease subunit
MGLIPGAICTVAVGHGVDATDLVFLGALGMPPFVVLGLVLFARGTDPRLVPGVLIGAGIPAVLLTLWGWFVIDPFTEPVTALICAILYWFLCPIVGGVLGAEVARGMLGID